MIIDSPIITPLALGFSGAIPEPGDSRVSIQPVVLPVVSPMAPTLVPNVLSLTPQNNSFLFSTEVAWNNSAGSTINLAKLTKGLWRLEISLNVISDFFVATGLVGGAIALDYQGAVTLLTKIYSPNAAAGIFVVYELLLIDIAVLDLIGGATTLAQHMNTQVTINARKLL